MNRKALPFAAALLCAALILTSCSAVLDSIKDAIASELSPGQTGASESPDAESAGENTVIAHLTALTPPSEPSTGTPSFPPSAESEPTALSGITDPETPVASPASDTETPVDTTTPDPETPVVTPTPDGIPYRSMPEIPEVVLPPEVFASDLEREAAQIIDGAICRALGLMLVMRDDRHSTVSFPFEEDPNGYLSSLTEKQRGLYRTIVGHAKAFDSFEITSGEYGGDVVSAWLDLSRAMLKYAPDVSSYFTASPAGMFSSITDNYFDPDTDSNDSVRSGAIGLDGVRHKAALLDAVIRRIVSKMPEGLSTYDKYCYFAAVICARNSYTDEPDNCYTPYGALIGGGSVCEGYSAAFYLLCREANLFCAYRAGVPAGGGHIWNMVKLEDGIYNIDVTWCDARTLGSKGWYAFFMKSDEAFVSDGHNANDGVKGTGRYAPCPYEK